MSISPSDEQEIRYQVAQVKELPPLPQSLKRLIEIIQTDIDSPSELESMISYDPSLVAKLVTIGNSTYYGFRGQVKTLSKAIQVIGVNQVKAISISTLLICMLANGNEISAVYREMLWKHSYICSRVVTAITRKRPWLDQDEASIFGLLHDLGWILMAAHFNEQFTAIIETAARTNVPPWYVEMKYGLSHSQLGKYLASRWALPGVLQAVIEFHHAPEKSKYFRKEVGLVYLANVLTHSKEYPELADDDSTLSCCRDLYISEDEWQEFGENVESIKPAADEFWNLLK